MDREDFEEQVTSAAAYLMQLIGQDERMRSEDYDVRATALVATTAQIAGMSVAALYFRSTGKILSTGEAEQSGRDLGVLFSNNYNKGIYDGIAEAIRGKEAIPDPAPEKPSTLKLVQ